MSAQLTQFLLTGLTIGAIYALVALGFAIIYNASHVINFAQGEFVMIGGMATVSLIQLGLPLLPAIALAVAASFQTNELHGLWYRFAKPGDVGPLLAAAAAHGRASGLKTLRLWETTPIPLPTGAQRVPRTDELPMLRALDGGASQWSFIERGLWA